MNEDLKSYIFFVGCHGVRIVFSALAMGILARLLGPEGMGHWALITAAATMLHLLFVNWFQQDPLLRFGREEWVKTGRMDNAWSSRLPFVAAGIAIAAVFFAAFPNWWMKGIFELDAKDGLFAGLFFLSLVVSTESQTFMQALNSMRRLAYLPVVIAAGSLAFYFLLRQSGGGRPESIYVALAGTALITIAVWGGFAIADMKIAQLRFTAPNAALIREMFRYSWPVLPTTMLGYLLGWGNQVLLHRFLDIKSVGIYQTAFQVHSLITAAAVPFTTIVLPKMIGRNIEDPQVTRRFITTVTPTLFFLWTLAMVPVVALVPWAVLFVFGPQFSESVGVLRALMIGTPVCAVGQIYTSLYSVQKKMWKIFAILAVMVVVNFAIALSLMEASGARGMAIAFGCSFLVSQFLMYQLQHRALGESARKIHLLFFFIALFSVGQYLIKGVPVRLTYDVIAFALFILLSRSAGLVDGNLLERLFAGRFQPIGTFFKKVLAA